jgi:nucleoid DNA-binding protein
LSIATLFIVILIKVQYLEVYILGNKNKSVITKENLINVILDKCREDYVSTEDLLSLIDNAVDEDGVLSKKKLIKSIKNYHTKSVIKDVYNLLENTIFNYLSSVDKKQDICIKLFEGISLDGIYVPEKTKKNNLTGEFSIVESKIKPKFNITRSYCEKLKNK